MKIYTSYFALVPKLREKGLIPVSIATVIPKWFQGTGIVEYKKLAPNSNMLKMSKSQYLPLFNKILMSHHPSTIIKELRTISNINENKDIVLLCCERAEDCDCGKSWCHRHIVAKWLQKELKEEVKEFRFADPEPTKPKIIQVSMF